MFDNFNGGINMKRVLFLFIAIFLIAPSAQSMNCYSANECTIYGEMYISSADYQEAINCFNQAIAINEKAYMAYVYRAKAYFYLKNYKQTFLDASKSIEIKPNPRGFGLRGSAKLAMGDYVGAVNDTSLALELNPNYMKCYEVRGRAKITLKDYKGALEDADSALKLRRNYAKSYEVRARAYLGLKEYTSAKRDFEVAEGMFKAQNDRVNEKKMRKMANYCKRRIK